MRSGLNTPKIQNLSEKISLNPQSNKYQEQNLHSPSKAITLNQMEMGSLKLHKIDNSMTSEQ